ncbi:MAG: hypothetical protein R3F00_01625 [Dokdonella sp.]
MVIFATGGRREFGIGHESSVDDRGAPRTRLEVQVLRAGLAIVAGLCRWRHLIGVALIQQTRRGSFRASFGLVAGVASLHGSLDFEALAGNRSAVDHDVDLVAALSGKPSGLAIWKVVVAAPSGAIDWLVSSTSWPSL